MKTLIVEDDFTSRLLLQEFLCGYGPTHIAVTGREALEAVRVGLQAGKPYDLICLDIKMPEMDGQEALREIRHLESTLVAPGSAGLSRARIVMTTALADEANITEAVQGRCDYFLAKPVRRADLIAKLRALKLVP